MSVGFNRQTKPRSKPNWTELEWIRNCWRKNSFSISENRSDGSHRHYAHFSSNAETRVSFVAETKCASPMERICANVCFVWSIWRLLCVRDQKKKLFKTDFENISRIISLTVKELSDLQFKNMEMWTNNKQCLRGVGRAKNLTDWTTWQGYKRFSTSWLVPIRQTKAKQKPNTLWRIQSTSFPSFETRLITLSTVDWARVISQGDSCTRSLTSFSVFCLWPLCIGTTMMQ